MRRPVAPRARRAFEALDRTARYRLVLPLLQALTPLARRDRLDRALQRLTGDGGPAA
ncbi:YdeI/OmpD-associated family protein [Kitasatospora sp. NPDC005748]|uniref:YdeI/OmpD-associated family protein n=1 Tax=Kitasatospora sp. NPDC005748 TaxID=3157063 RepID=UPI00340804F4